jgi:ACR3 family arsenite efflux pump ArsB
MKTFSRFLLLLLHLCIVSIITFYVGDYFSKPLDLIYIPVGMIIYIGLIFSVIYHIKNFIFSILNK